MNFKYVYKYLHIVVLIFLMIIGFLFRFVLEPKSPMGFYRDEAGILYSAYSILETGRDQWGAFMPLHFKSLGDYPPGIYNYLTAISIRLFGYGELAERMPSIVFGTMLIPLTYIFVKKVFENNKLAIVVSTLVCFSPWEIVQSRSGSEPIVAIVFTLLGILFYRNFLLSKKAYARVLSLSLMSVCYFLTIYTYNASRMMLPVIHGLFLWYWLPDIKKLYKYRFELIIWILVGIVSVGSVFLTSASSYRFNSVSIQNIDTATTQLVFSTREIAQRVPSMISEVIHNRPWLITDVFIQNYFSHFSPNFLFFQGGYPLRYKIPDVGVLPYYLVFFVFFIPASYPLIKKKQWKLLILLLLLSPLPSAITKEDIPHVKRSLYMYIPLYILFSLSILSVWNRISKYAILKIVFVLAFFIVFSWSQVQFWTNYLFHSKYSTLDDRSYGYEKVFTYLDDKYENSSIYFYENFDTPYIFYLVYQKYDPQKFQHIAQNIPTNLFLDVKDKMIWKLENYTYIPASCPESQDLIQDIVYVTKGECGEKLRSYIDLKYSVQNPDGFNKFVIFTQKSK